MIYDIREYREEDIGALKALWHEAFGDSYELIGAFFELLPSMGTGLVGELDGEIFGMAYVLDAFLHLPDNSTKRVAYIYAVAVDASAQGRGLGAELGRACMRYAWESGADVCCTLPAEDTLYDWYAERCGLKPTGFCRYEQFEASPEVREIKRLNSDEYAFLREDKLRGTAHVGFYYGYMRFQEEIFLGSGGGFFEYGGGIACGYVEDGVLYIKEALGDSDDFIPALCTTLGAKKAVVRRSDSFGERYISAYQPQEFPAETVWNLTLD